jgi:glycosyltransferase involved in cell wall biosynthesis
MKPKVIGVILAYKHASYLENLYKSLPAGAFDEIIVTNDESGDGIEVIAERLGIPCFSHERLRYGGNMKYGMRKAIERGADYVVEIHGDGQFDVNAAGPAVSKAEEGYDLVMGSRFFTWRQPLRDHMPLIRFFANIGLSALARFILGSRLTEFHNGFRVYSKRLIETVDLDASSNDFLFGFEIIAQAHYAGLRITEVPVRCFYGQEHTTISIPKATEYAFQMIGVLLKYLGAKFGFTSKLFGSRR